MRCRLQPLLLMGGLLIGLTIRADADIIETDATQPVVSAKGLEAATPPATPAADGHLIISATRSQVFVPKGAYVELVPPLRQVSPVFAPVDAYLLVNERLSFCDPLPDKPATASYLVDSSGRGGSSIKRIALGVLDITNHAQELMRCTVRATDPGRRVALQIEKQGDTTRLRVPNRSEFGAVYLFCEQRYLGRLPANADTTVLDMRQTPIGTYTLTAMAETDDGILLPVSRAYLTVTPRYQIDGLPRSELVHIYFEQSNPALPLRIACVEGADIAQTRIYLNGRLVGESAKAIFEIAISLRDVPAGNVNLQLMGISKEGVKRPVETITLQIEREEGTETELQRTEIRSSSNGVPN